MADYLVTGVAGFIVNKVAGFLLADVHTVVGIDNLNHAYDVASKSGAWPSSSVAHSMIRLGAALQVMALMVLPTDALVEFSW